MNKKLNVKKGYYIWKCWPEEFQKHTSGTGYYQKFLLMFLSSAQIAERTANLSNRFKETRLVLA